MLPLLYRSPTAVPSPANMQYIGRLTKCQKCVVNTQINSNFDVSASFSVNDELVPQIQNQYFLLAKANPFDDPQFFEIYDVEEENNEISIKGRHIKHCAYNNVIYPDYAESGTGYNGTPREQWYYNITRGTLAFNNHFTFSSNINTSASMEIGFSRSDSVGKFLEEMAEAFGGEFHYNNFEIDFKQSIGQRKNYVLRWNSNMDAPKLTLTGDSIYSHVVAYGVFHVLTTGLNYNVQLCSVPVAIGSGQKLNKVYMYDATDTFDSTDIDRNQFAFYREELQLRAIAFVNGAGRALQTKESVNLKVNYRPALDEMAAVGLGDTIDVMLKSGRTVEAKITETSFDSLSERWTSITLGKEKLTLADYIVR